MSFASCCVLSYNRPQFLRDCLRTIRDAGAPFELIVHDDGSTNPECRHIIGEGIEDGTISTAILNPPGHNQGQGVALNRMFHAAAGDPIIKLDQDLQFRPGWLEAVSQLLDSNRETPFEPRIGLLGLFHYWHEPCDSRRTTIEHYGAWTSRTHILGSAFAVTRECWEQLGPFPEHSAAFAEDWELQQRVTASDGFVCALPADDLVTNQGFGVGPSTVVVAEGEVQQIHTAPVIQ